MARAVSPALRRYFRRLFFFIALYVAILVPVVWARNHGHWPSAPWSYLAALAPVLPVLGVIWCIFAYAQEETDEYRRFILLKVHVLAFGLTLAVCTAWNFLSEFTGVLPARIWVVSVWCACLFPAQAWVYWRAR